jgi:hypothetical protein
VWLRCEESRRDEVVARLRAHRPVRAAAPQGDLVLAMGLRRAQDGRAACQRFGQLLAEVQSEVVQWTVAHQAARRVRYQGRWRWGSGPSPDPEDYSDS